VCAKQVLSSSGDAFYHDRSAETMYKLHKQHVKVVSWIRDFFRGTGSWSLCPTKST